MSQTRLPVTRPGGQHGRPPRDGRRRRRRPDRRPLAALVAASVLWGGAISGTKYALGGFGPLTLLSVELVAAASVLWIVLLIRGYRPPGSWWLPALLGLLEPGLAYLAETFGLSLTTAVHGAVISGLEAALIVVLAAVVLRETIRAAAVLAVVVALAGLVVLAGGGGGQHVALGDLLVAGGVLSASLYTIVAKRFEDGSDVLSLTTWQFTAAALVCLPAAVVSWATGAQGETLAVPPRFWVAALLVGVAGFGASFLLFNQVIGRVRAGWSGIVLNLIPVFAFLSAISFLGEDVTGADAAGATLVGASVAYFVIAERRAERAAGAGVPPAGPGELSQQARGLPGADAAALAQEHPGRPVVGQQDLPGDPGAPLLGGVGAGVIVQAGGDEAGGQGADLDAGLAPRMGARWSPPPRRGR
jgi:drug/metabolite transporter (DMT)-like permease